HIRALLLQGLAGCGLALRRLDSNDLDAGRVAVAAFATAARRVDADVEKIVGRLSLEQTVSAARWQAELRLDDEDRHATNLSAGPHPDPHPGPAAGGRASGAVKPGSMRSPLGQAHRLSRPRRLLARAFGRAGAGSARNSWGARARGWRGQAGRLDRQCMAGPG